MYLGLKLDGAIGGSSEGISTLSSANSTSNPGIAQPRHRPVDHRPVALLQRVEEAGVGSHQDEPAAVLVTHLQRAEPGGELVGIELLLQAVSGEETNRIATWDLK